MCSGIKSESSQSQTSFSLHWRRLRLRKSLQPEIRKRCIISYGEALLKIIKINKLNVGQLNYKFPMKYIYKHSFNNQRNNYYVCFHLFLWVQWASSPWIRLYLCRLIGTIIPSNCVSGTTPCRGSNHLFCTPTNQFGHVHSSKY